MTQPAPSEYVVTPDVPDPYLLEGIQDIEDPSWFPFTTDGASTFDEQRHGHEGVLTIHGFRDLLGHLKEPEVEEVREWMEGDRDERDAPEWLAAELQALFKQSWLFEMFIPGTRSDLGMGTAQVITTGSFPLAPREGRAWVFFSVGVELPGAASVRIYKGGIPGSGANRLVGSSNGVTATGLYFPYAKGALILHNGNTLGFLAGTSNFQSIYATGIDLPMSRVAEFVTA